MLISLCAVNRDGEFHKVYDREMVRRSIVNFLEDPTGDLPWDEDPTAQDVLHIQSTQVLLSLRDLPSWGEQVEHPQQNKLCLSLFLHSTNSTSINQINWSFDEIQCALVPGIAHLVPEEPL